MSNVERWLEHVRVLAEEIGPRGPTTEGERRGTEYCHDVLSGLHRLRRDAALTTVRRAP